MPMKKSENFWNVMDYIMKVIDFIASIMMVALTIVVFGEVLSRYVFNFPLVFSNELTLLLFPWVIFLMYFKNGHLYFQNWLCSSFLVL